MLAVCGAMLASSAMGAEVYPLAGEGGANRLTNPGFEQRDGDQPRGWSAYEAGGVVEAGAGRNGSAAARARRTSAADPGAGFSQSVTLDQTTPMPLVATGWSRAEGVDGAPDSDYSLYCDLEYTDGTPLWGQISAFDVGSHDWQRARVTIVPEKPVRRITVYALCRHHLGTAWFDDFSLTQVATPPGGGRLDTLAVQAAATPRGDGGNTSAADRLAVTFDGSRVTGVKLGGADVTGASPGGFFVRDVAADGGWHGFDGGHCAELGLHLDLSVKEHPTHLELSGRVVDETGRPRAVTLLFALPVRRGGWQWGQGPSTAHDADSAPESSNVVGVECGSNGLISRYPFANLSRQEGGLNLAIDPDAPAQFRLGYSSGPSLFYLAYDFGLTPVTKAFPSAAPFKFALFASDGAWGFRAGLEAWQKVFPDAFRMRTPDQGIWMAFAATSRVQGFEDFGFKFKEGNGEPAWDWAHGLLPFRYSEMGTYWMSMPPAVPRTYEQALAILQAQAADAKHAWSQRQAQAILGGGSEDAQGRLQLRFENAPWCNGCVWSNNPSPYLEAPMTQAKMVWDDAARAPYEPGAKVPLAGEYLDSLEGYVTAPLNYRPDHLAAVHIPLTFDLRERRPAIYKIFSIAEFAQYLAADLHARGKLMFANGVPFRFGFLGAYFDVMGTETDWGREGKWTPDSDEDLLYRRAICGQRPYLLLMNTHFENFGPYVERYFQRALAYGMYPSMFSYNAANDHYFEHPEWYNRDRALFRKYIPRIKALAEKGWEPVTGARIDNAALRVERFGRATFTVHNPSAKPRSGKLTGDRVPAPREVTVDAYGTEIVEE